MVRKICGVQLKERKISKDLLLILDSNKTIGHLSMAISVHWYDHVLWIEDGHMLRTALVLEDKGQMKKGRLKRTLKREMVEGNMNVGLRGKTC